MANQSNHRTTSKPATAPVVDLATITGVILAAGNGSRIQSGGPVQPKPLIRLGGLSLAERSVLTLHQAGLRKFHIVTGAYGDQVEAALKASKRLKGLDVEYVRCATYERGNGESLAAGTAGIEGAFVVVMADHVFSVSAIQSFLTAVAGTTDAPYLATDLRIDGVFDIDDATKVFARDGRIEKISKELASYNEIDTGLFYFPAGAARVIADLRAKGATSVSEVVSHYVREREFRTQNLPPEAFWQDVDTVEMAREAERKMLNSLRKPTDGYVSRVLNRSVSLRISRVLTNWGVSPSTVTTFTFIISCFSAYLASTGSWMNLALAGLIFQFASIVDGCDGEIARIAFKGTRFGAWYDTLTDNIRYGLFFASMGVGIYNNGGSVGYLWGSAFFMFMIFFLVTMMISYAFKTNQANGTHLVVTAGVTKAATEKKGWWDRYVISLRGLVKQDVTALLAMFFCFFNLRAGLFYGGAFGLLMMLISVVRVMPAASTSRYPKISWLKDLAPFAYFSIGFALLAYLVNASPRDEIFTALNQLRKETWVFLALPLVWLAASVAGTAFLSRNRIGVVESLPNAIVTQALNALIPLAGLAGEPYRVRFFATKMRSADAVALVVKDKFAHIVAGFLCTGVSALLAVRFTSLSEGYANSLHVSGWGLLGLGIALFFAGTSSRVGAWVEGAMRRSFVFRGVKLVEQDRRLMLGALAWKIVSRSLMFLEILIFLKMLNLPTDAGMVFLLGTLVGASGLVFFLIPQGIGVAEASLSIGFTLLGVPLGYGVAFGLLRRSRILIWSIIGVSLLALVSLFAPLKNPLGKVERARSQDL